MKIIENNMLSREFYIDPSKLGEMIKRYTDSMIDGTITDELLGPGSLRNICSKNKTLEDLFKEVQISSNKFSRKISDIDLDLSVYEIIRDLDNLIPLLTELQLRLEGIRDENMDNVLGES